MNAERTDRSNRRARETEYEDKSRRTLPTPSASSPIPRPGGRRVFESLLNRDWDRERENRATSAVVGVCSPGGASLPPLECGMEERGKKWSRKVENPPGRSSCLGPATRRMYWGMGNLENIGRCEAPDVDMTMCDGATVGPMSPSYRRRRVENDGACPRPPPAYIHIHSDIDIDIDIHVHSSIPHVPPSLPSPVLPALITDQGIRGVLRHT